jgi:hypothetical protein
MGVWGVIIKYNLYIYVKPNNKLQCKCEWSKTGFRNYYTKY